MYMPEGESHPSTMPGFKETRDPERAVTRSRSGRKKKRVEFEDVQPQSIPNSTEENFPRRYITQLPDGVSHIYYTGKELTYWFNEYCGVGHPIVKEELEDEARIPLDPPFNISLHISPAALHEMRQARFIDCEQFLVGEERETYASYRAEQILEDFSLPDEAEGPDPGWHMEWTGRREMFPIVRLRDPPPMSSSYGVEELWHLTHGMRRLVLTEFVRDVQRFKELEDKLVIAHRQIDSIDHQLYAHNLQLRRGRDVRVVSLPHGDCARTRQRESGPRTRGGGTSRRGRGTGDESE
ncbi:hypothetical protein GIB67_039338 [Kingdonia uniflora]|uniref:Uncharacterized protein n=1 Tax=Kingdonia uniflora TaxID=39325 RepID=A0A7J7LXE1_9MAGN|nr:hypothetical protein GIB67_039338 [Kingdonia uniflora]